MATNNKTIVWVGDTIPLEFECLEPQAEDENEYQFTQVAVFPTDAYVKVWHVNNQEFLDLGGSPEPTEDAVTITQNVLSYVVDSVHTAEATDLKVFVTATFPDGQIVTELREYRVKEKQ